MIRAGISNTKGAPMCYYKNDCLTPFGTVTGAHLQLPLALLPSIVEFFVKALAVVGGAAIASWLIVFVARRLGRLVSTATLPPRPVLVLRLLGGLAGAWVVWLMVFSAGGSGLFGGGGSLFGERGATNANSPTGTPEPSLPTVPPEPTPAPPAANGIIRITLLGGTRVVGGRYYRIEGDEAAHTLGEIKKIIKDQQSKGQVRVLELLIYEDSVARNHAAVQDLEQWARQNNLTVSIPPIKGEIPLG
jgi:hypothetical protein